LWQVLFLEPVLLAVSLALVSHSLCNLLEIPQLGLEPMAGIEPATDGLRNRCSTAELHWHRCQAARIATFRDGRHFIVETFSVQAEAIKVLAAKFPLTDPKRNWLPLKGCLCSAFDLRKRFNQ
jgi:hypothetical protein